MYHITKSCFVRKYKCNIKSIISWIIPSTLKISNFYCILYLLYKCNLWSSIKYKCEIFFFRYKNNIKINIFLLVDINKSIINQVNINKSNFLSLQKPGWIL